MLRHAALAVAAMATSASAIEVVVTLSDIEPIVQAVGGADVRTHAVMPSGSDPHGFSAAADDVRRIDGADLVVLANSSFLAFEANLIEGVDPDCVVHWPDYERHGARLLDFPDNPANQHGFWLDHTNAAAIAHAVADALIGAGEDSVQVRARLRAFADELAAASEFGLGLARDVEAFGDTVIASVPGVAYICSNVGLVVEHVLLAEGAGYVGGRRLEQIAGMLRSGRATSIVCPLSMRQAKPGMIAEQLSRDTGAPVRYVHFLSGATGAGRGGTGSYVAQARANAEALTEHIDTSHLDPEADEADSTEYLSLAAIVAALAVAAWWIAKRNSGELAG